MGFSVFTVQFKALLPTYMLFLVSKFCINVMWKRLCQPLCMLFTVLLCLPFPALTEPCKLP